MDPDTLPAAIGAAIRGHRGAAGISQEEFAHVVGLHRTYIGSVERGERNITVRNLARIAGALGLEAWELLREAEQSTPRAAHS